MSTKKAKTSYDWLQDLLRGMIISHEEVISICSIREETDFMDFKESLDEITATQKPSRSYKNKILRKFASAFSNGEGGFLMVGVHDKITKDGISRPILGLSNTLEEKDLETHVKNVLRDVSVFIYPSPKVQVVQCGDKKVGIIAFSRSPGGLVPDRTEKPDAYWLRFGDGCRKIPEYLLADLKTGIRSRPFFILKSTQETSISLVADSSTKGRNLGPKDVIDCRRLDFYVNFCFLFENGGLTHGDDIDCGIIGPSLSPLTESSFNNIPTSILSYVDFDDVCIRQRSLWRYKPPQTVSAKPFDIFKIRCNTPFMVSAPVPAHGVLYQYSEVQFCAYIIARNGMVQWFDLNIKFSSYQDFGKPINITSSFQPTGSPRSFWTEHGTTTPSTD